MKRIYIAFFLLALVIASCVGTLLLEMHQLERMIDMTTQMETRYRGGDTDGAKEWADKLHREFDGRTRTFALFLRHNELRDIEEIIVVLPLYLEQDDDDHFLTEVTRCRLLLQKQLEMDLPTLQNVF